LVGNSQLVDRLEQVFACGLDTVLIAAAGTPIGVTPVGKISIGAVDVVRVLDHDLVIGSIGTTEMDDYCAEGTSQIDEVMAQAAD